MTKMLTLFGEEFQELGYNELKRERKVQVFFLKHIQKLLQKEQYKHSKLERVSIIGEDKIQFFDTYAHHLEALVAEIDYWMEHRSEPFSNYRGGHKQGWQIKQENEAKRKRVINENAKLYGWQKQLERDNLLVSWDRQRFMLIAKDRGYQTEEALFYDIGKELNLDRARSRTLINVGRFTWGQVLCLGAMLQMTPKEFCDVFLSGYFVDTYGDYRASYENISRAELLKKVIKPLEPVKEDIPEEGSDCKSSDE